MNCCQSTAIIVASTMEDWLTKVYRSGGINELLTVNCGEDNHVSK